MVTQKIVPCILSLASVKEDPTGANEKDVSTYVPPPGRLEHVPVHFEAAIATGEKKSTLAVSPNKSMIIDALKATESSPAVVVETTVRSPTMAPRKG